MNGDFVAFAESREILHGDVMSDVVEELSRALGALMIDHDKVAAEEVVEPAATEHEGEDGGFWEVVGDLEDEF